MSIAFNPPVLTAAQMKPCDGKMLIMPSDFSAIYLLREPIPDCEYLTPNSFLSLEIQKP